MKELKINCITLFFVLILIMNIYHAVKTIIILFVVFIQIT